MHHPKCVQTPKPQCNSHELLSKQCNVENTTDNYVSMQQIACDFLVITTVKWNRNRGIYITNSDNGMVGQNDLILLEFLECKHTDNISTRTGDKAIC